MGSGLRRKFCDGWFGRRQGLGQMGVMVNQGGMASQGILIDSVASQGGMTSRVSMRANHLVGCFIGSEIEDESNMYTSGVGDGSVGDGSGKHTTPHLRRDTSRSRNSKSNSYVSEVGDDSVGVAAVTT